MKGVITSLNVLILTIVVLVGIIVSAGLIFRSITTVSSQKYYEVASNVDMKVSRISSDKIIIVLYAKKPVNNLTIKTYCVIGNRTELVFSGEVSMSGDEEKHFIVNTPANTICYSILLDNQRVLFKTYEN